MTMRDAELARQLEMARGQVDAIQTKLQLRAKGTPSQPIDELYELLHHPAFIAAGLDEVLRKDGADTPGVDGMTARVVEALGRNHCQAEIERRLRTQRYWPTHLRPVRIPKKNGKYRELLIPTLFDRVVLKEMTLIFEPIFEPTFQSTSYAYRRNRSCPKAIKDIHDALVSNPSFTHVLDADIRACFDNFNHAALLRLVRTRVGDKRVMKLLREFMKASMVINGQPVPRTKGIPQGSPLSPLLCNIGLNELDLEVARLGSGQQQSPPRSPPLQPATPPAIFRYADDFVVLVAGGRQAAEQVRGHIQDHLRRELDLELSEEKTRIKNTRKGFRFLGHSIRKTGPINDPTCLLRPAPKKVAKLMTEVAELRDKNKSPGRRLLAIENKVKGFLAYFKNANDPVVMTTIREHVSDAVKAIGTNADTWLK